MTAQGPFDNVPVWSGDASEFEAYVTACKWYAKATKENERPLVVARLWGKLKGAAKSVVRHLEPDDFESKDGLELFLQILRDSPLQQLPIPDSFSRLERWNQLRRHDRETISELLVREEEHFTELLQALGRARTDRSVVRAPPGLKSRPSSPAREPQRGPPSTPSRSVIGQAADDPGSPSSPKASGAQAKTSTATGISPEGTNDFFSDELRGYRLLKAARLTYHERQNVLVQTADSTHFQDVRRALRTLFSEDPERGPVRGTGKVWYNEADDWAEYQDESAWADGSPGSYESYDMDYATEQYWSDWPSDDWWSWDQYEDYAEPWPEGDEVQPDETADGPEEAQLREAFTIAGEANKTLKDAREAVRRVRQARGYFAPESNTGKGLTFQSQLGKGKGGGKGKFSGSKGKSSSKGFGPCFICGMSGHGYQSCPDRFSKGPKGKGQKGSFGKGKPKGKVHYYDVHMNIFAAQWDETSSHERSPTWALLDTGATENAVGVDTLGDMVKHGGFSYAVSMDDRPTFRFGNGLKDQAVSRVDLHDTSLGPISFYVLGGSGCKTPPLIGGRTLRSKNVLMSYGEGLFMYSNVSTCGRPCTVKLNPMKSGHMAIDLSEEPAKLDIDLPGQKSTGHESNLVEPVVGHKDVSVLAFSRCSPEKQTPHEIFTMNVEQNLSDRLQTLAHQLHGLRQAQRGNERQRSPSGLGRSSPRRMAVHGEPQDRQDSQQPTWNMDFLRKMWFAHELQAQGGANRPVPSSWPRSSCDQLCHRGAEAADESRPVHREGDEWQAHGSQGQTFADGHRPDHGGQPDLQGVPGESGEGDQKCEDWSGRGFDTNANDVNGSGSCSRGNGKSELGLGSREQRFEDEAPAGGSFSISNGNDVAAGKGQSGTGQDGAQEARRDDQSEGGILGRNRDDDSVIRPDGGERGQEGVSLLWQALGALRRKMKMATGTTNTTSHPPNPSDDTTCTTSPMASNSNGGSLAATSATTMKSAMPLESPISLSMSSPQPSSTSLQSPMPQSSSMSMTVPMSLRSSMSPDGTTRDSLTSPTAPPMASSPDAPLKLLASTSWRSSTTPPLKSTTTSFCASATACSCGKRHHPEGIMLSEHGTSGPSPAATRPNSNNEKPVINDKNVMAGSSTSKMAKGLAALGAMVLLPVHGLLTQIAGKQTSWR
eukprot:s669_g3.t1